MRKILGLAALTATLACSGASAQQVNVKIGVLSDMSSLYSNIVGPGSVVTAKLAIVIARRVRSDAVHTAAYANLVRIAETTFAKTALRTSTQ